MVDKVKSHARVIKQTWLHCCKLNVVFPCITFSKNGSLFSSLLETHKAGLSSASHASMLDKRDWTNESTEAGNTPTELQEPYAPHSGLSTNTYFIVAQP